MATIPTNPSSQEIFLRHLKTNIGTLIQDGDLSEDDWNKAVRTAIGHSGGMATARKRRESKQASEHGMVDIAEICSKNSAGSWRLFTEIGDVRKMAEPPSRINYLPKPGVYRHSQYGDVVINHERNERFVENFKQGIYQDRLPIDAEHKTKLSGATGWITDLQMNEDGSVDAVVDWTDRGKKLIEKDRFRYFSPEFFDEWADPSDDEGTIHRDIAIGGALTTRPYFKNKNLRPLVATEEGLLAFSEGDDDVVTFEFTDEDEDSDIEDEDSDTEGTEEDEGGDADESDEFSEPHPDDCDCSSCKMKKRLMKASEGDTDDEEDNEMSVKATEITPQAFAEMRTTLRQMTERAETAEKANKEFSERLNKMEATDRHRRFTDVVLGRSGSGDGRAWTGDVEKHVSFMEKLAASFGEESDEFKQYCERENAIAEQLASSGLFSEKGSSARGSTSEAPQTKLMQMAEAMAKDKGISLAKAIDTVAVANPKLYTEYTEAR